MQVMADNARRWLTDSIRTLLIPEFEKRGFVTVPLTAKEARSEFRTAFPFGRFRRPSPSGFEMVEIQLDKHAKPAFRLNLGIAPTGGIEHVVGHVNQEDLWVHHLPQYYEVEQSPRLQKWFSVRRWFGSPQASDYEELVRGVVEILPEIEQALRDGKLGPHVRRV
jgi:hypothetical protein